MHNINELIQHIYIFQIDRKKNHSYRKFITKNNIQTI